MFLAALLATFGLAFAGPLTHRLSGRWANWLLAAAPAAWFAWLLTLMPEIRDGNAWSESIDWVPSLAIRASFHIDGLSLLMALIVTGVGALIMVYAGAYLGHNEKHIGRFYAFMLAFIAAMLGLVTADNLIVLFVFWELTSILSFLLIGFKHEYADSRKSAQQALIITGGGGLALLGGLVILGVESGQWELSAIREAGWTGEGAVFAAALVLIALGAFTKSAQVPFHGWLPNAMVAPTPVSAYLHSAAMVKAGIYLLARVYPTFHAHELWQLLLIPAGLVTMLLGAWFAIRQDDLKRILAYTTLSALGTLTLLLGLGTDYGVKAAVVFLGAHALYKGALFMAAGAIDHGAGTRDITRLRNLWRDMPTTSVALVLAAVSMAGIPVTLGYLAKETFLVAGLELESGAFFLLAAAIVSGALALAAASLITVRPLRPREPTDRHAAHEGSPGLWFGPIVLALTGWAAAFLYVPLSSWVVTPAASGAAGAPIKVSLHLIPEDPAVLVLSLLTIATGVALAFLLHRSPSLRYAVRLPELADRTFAISLKGLNSGSRAYARTAQNGRLKVYLAISIAVAVLAMTWPMILRDGWRRPPGMEGLELFEATVALVIIVSALIAATIHSRMAAVAALSVMGYGVALLYAIYGAPDLALTQVLVETLTVLLFVFVFLHLPPMRTLSKRRSRLADAVLAGCFGAMMTGIAWAVLAENPEMHLAEYFRQTSAPLAFGRNIVNTILVDFRALDTLGEITVLAVATLGAFALLNLRVARRGPR